MENKYSINTTQNVNLDFEIAGIGDRLIALIIDYLILAGFGILIGIGLSQFSFSPHSNYFYIIIAIYGFFTFFFHFILELIFRGQSFGKRYRKIKVIHTSGREAGFFNYLIRNIIRIVDSFYAIGIIVVFFNKKSQRIGDIAANTMVVKFQKKTNLQNTVFSNIEVNYNPTFDKINVIRLNEKDIELIKEVINRPSLEINWKLIELTAQKIKEKTLINSSEMKNLLFLQTIIKDYTFHILN